MRNLLENLSIEVDVKLKLPLIPYKNERIQHKWCEKLGQ